MINNGNLKASAWKKIQNFGDACQIHDTRLEENYASMFLGANAALRRTNSDTAAQEIYFKNWCQIYWGNDDNWQDIKYFNAFLNLFKSSSISKVALHKITDEVLTCALKRICTGKEECVTQLYKHSDFAHTEINPQILREHRCWHKKKNIISSCGRKIKNKNALLDIKIICFGGK